MTPQGQFTGYRIGASYQSGILEPKNHGITKVGKRHLRSPSPITSPALPHFHQPCTATIFTWARSTMCSSVIATGFLDIFRSGDSTASLGSLLQCLATLLMKKIFLIFDLNLPWCNFLSSCHLLLGKRDWHPTHFNNFFQDH